MVKLVSRRTLQWELLHAKQPQCAQVACQHPMAPLCIHPGVAQHACAVEVYAVPIQAAPELAVLLQVPLQLWNKQILKPKPAEQ
jgi:hypothetical protein